MPEPRSTASTISLGLAYAGVVLAGVGPGVANLGLAAPMSGFLLFAAGLLLGVLAFAFGLVGLLRTWGGIAPGARTRAWAGTALGAALGAMLVLLAPSAQQHPINDVTTNPEAPPEFRLAARDPANRDRDLAYAGAELARAQRDLYPDLRPIELAEDLPRAFERAQRAAEQLGWEIQGSDAAAGMLEARAVSRLFHFVDDIVVRVRPAASGAVVDVRSKSREGKSDLGANAERIRAFAAALAESPAVSTR